MHAQIHDGQNCRTQAQINVQDGSRPRVLRHIQQSFPQLHAQNRPAGKHANARQGLLRRDDNKLLVACRLRGKRLRRVVPIVLRRRRRVLRRTAQNGFFSHENAWLRRRLLRLPLFQKEVTARAQTAKR